MKRFAILLALVVSLFLVQAAAAELVVNGGFETGTFSGWTLAADPDYTGVDVPSNFPGIVHTGSYGAFLGEWESPMGFLSQTLLNTTPNASYKVEFWLRSRDQYTPNQFQASWDGNILPFFSQSNITSQVYTHYEFTQVASGSSTLLKFGFLDSPSYLYLDDVSVNPVPIPGAVWLLGSGLVGLAGLRRKFKS